MNNPRWYKGLGSKLAASFILGVLFVSLLLLYVERTLSHTIADTQMLLEEQLQPLALVNRLQAQLLVIREQEAELQRTSDHFALLGQVESLQEELAVFEIQLVDLLGLLANEDTLKEQQIRANWQRYTDKVEKMAEAAVMQDQEAIRNISVYQASSRFQALIHVFRQFSYERQALSEAIYRQLLDRKSKHFTLFLIAAVITLFILAAFLGTFILRLLRRVLELRDGAQKLAQEGQVQPLAVRGEDELAQLTLAFNQMQEKIKAREEALSQANENLELRVAERTQELRDSNAELEQFAYVTSHDLRQPLRMINSYLQMLERRLGDQLDDENRQMMDFASEGAQRLDQMLISLLEYSRVGRRGQPMQLLNSKQAVDEALSFLRPQINEEQAQIKLQESGWPELYASRDELTRLFQNLLCNAIKYHAKGQQPQVEVSVQPKGKQWLFLVKDQGIGIPVDQQDRLFKVFQRLQARSDYEGTGVGLAICKKIVERHGGRIWVESQGEDQGSCFCFTLPGTLPVGGLTGGQGC
ncbi:His Kinase A (phospho-acceptor) domain-containing protein [Marinospirillum celere]|uniref:histidine kinase n=1 Tax=Marinospirillum celere TaxID=1122252 RepID=A0A1I1J781_9GAMM|nr:ATP-binding protein [Marinospirillum celere]SFC44404.1 His Kinase A (phospho-acceptor) domain-containing protein [Marinospirillum celere]